MKDVNAILGLIWSLLSSPLHDTDLFPTYDVCMAAFLMGLFVE